MASQAGPDAHWVGQLACRGLPKSRLTGLRPVHQILLVVNGIYLLENLKLEELAAKRVYEFAFIMQPLKMQGFSGSTVAPIAVR